jgi:Domain of unknown function (DUF4388)
MTLFMPRKTESENQDQKPQLPWQLSPPTFQQLKSMQQQCLQTGISHQLSFGDAMEEHIVAVSKSRGKGEVQWTLYRGDRCEGSMMVWNLKTNDPGSIHQMIAAQFPGSDIKQTAAPVLNQYSEATASPAIKSVTDHLFNERSLQVRDKEKPSLEGDLRRIPLSSVLQSILMGKNTGFLELENALGTASIIFEDGHPIHCLNKADSGEDAFLDLIGWEEGVFRFFNSKIEEERTIKRGLAALLIEGTTMADHSRALQKLGGTSHAVLRRKHANLSEHDFEESLQHGLGTDLVLHKRIYLSIDGRTRLIDLVRRFNLTKQQWVSIMFNLANCNLIEFTNRLPDTSTRNLPEVKIDWSAVDATQRLLSRADTDIFNYPTLLVFLQDELTRWERFGRPFSLIFLTPGLASQDSPHVSSLPTQNFKELAEKINKLKRKTDVLTHDDASGFALLLLETDLRTTRTFANRLVTALRKTSLSSLPSTTQLVIKAGAACVPDDCDTLALLIDRARLSTLIR